MIEREGPARVPGVAINQVTRGVIGAGIQVHRELGPGLMESAYQRCMEVELEYQGIRFEQQVPLPITYRGVPLDASYRMDFVVEGMVVLELKSVASFAPIHSAQMLTYLKLSGHPLGLLINFNVPLLTDGGIRRLAL